MDSGAKGRGGSDRGDGRRTLCFAAALFRLRGGAARPSQRRHWTCVCVPFFSSAHTSFSLPSARLKLIEKTDELGYWVF
nr:hypothetical protein Itr_chr02CG06170 [Ipomoea trifida]